MLSRHGAHGRQLRLCARAWWNWAGYATDFCAASPIHSSALADMVAQPRAAPDRKACSKEEARLARTRLQVAAGKLLMKTAFSPSRTSSWGISEMTTAAAVMASCPQKRGTSRLTRSARRLEKPSQDKHHTDLWQLHITTEVSGAAS